MDRDDTIKWVSSRMQSVPLHLFANEHGHFDWDEWQRLNPPACNTEDCEGCEDCDEQLHAFPFAWGTAWLPDFDIDPEDASAAGFLLYEFREEQVLGVDGGGYDFYEQHWAVLKQLVRKRLERLVEA